MEDDAGYGIAPPGQCTVVERNAMSANPRGAQLVDTGKLEIRNNSSSRTATAGSTNGNVNFALSRVASVFNTIVANQSRNGNDRA